MIFDHPLTFAPLYKERIWGGRLLTERLARTLPPDSPIGESWELVDREDDQSIINHGPHTGLSLHDLWTQHREAVFGPSAPDLPRFPLLAKILDAREKLSVQVHPPAHLATELKGEPKTEMWYLLDADPEADLFVGFRDGVTRESFDSSLRAGTCADLLHRIPVKSGDFIFIPSGRCHAIGAGCFIIEIQQNSDTTYRVFDWNRVDAAGKPRDLHIAESLASIDFNDHEPPLDQAHGETLVSCDYFRVDQWTLTSTRREGGNTGSVFTVIEGSVRCGGRQFQRGDFFLLPVSANDRDLTPTTSAAKLLRSIAV